MTFKESGIHFTRCFHWNFLFFIRCVSCSSIHFSWYFQWFFSFAVVFIKININIHTTIFKPLLLGWSIFVWLSRFVDWAWVRACICFCYGLSVRKLCVSDRCLTATATAVDSLSFSRQHTLNLLRFTDSAAHQDQDEHRERNKMRIKNDDRTLGAKYFHFHRPLITRDFKREMLSPVAHTKALYVLRFSQTKQMRRGVFGTVLFSIECYRMKPKKNRSAWFGEAGKMVQINRLEHKFPSNTWKMSKWLPNYNFHRLFVNIFSSSNKWYSRCHVLTIQRHTKCSLG